MHYKNGREAKEGDPIIFKNWDNKVVGGTLFNLNSNAGSCNGNVAGIIPGGTEKGTVTVGECYHAEDAFGALEVLPTLNAQLTEANEKLAAINDAAAETQTEAQPETEKAPEEAEKAAAGDIPTA